jgi:hypothetical protein
MVKRMIKDQEIIKEKTITNQEVISKRMITDQEMLDLMELKAGEYEGIGGDLISAVGVLVLSRFYGWRVIRLIASRRQWNVTIKTFGNIKAITPERGKYARKSVGLDIADKIGDYWAYMRGQKNSKEDVGKSRQMIVDAK